MKKLFLTLFVWALAATSAFASGSEREFVLINNTGKTITSVYFSPSKASDWKSEDELENVVLRSGESINISFEPWGNSRNWDLRADFDDDTFTEWYDFDLYKVVSITLEPNSIASYELEN